MKTNMYSDFPQTFSSGRWVAERATLFKIMIIFKSLTEPQRDYCVYLVT